MKKENLEKLFNSQIQIIKDRGCPEQIVKMLQGQKAAVLKKASEMSFTERNIPFIPVIPRTFRSPYDLMAMVRNGSKAGYNYLNPTAIADVVETPQEPYHIYDIEDGQALLDKSPEKAIDIIEKQSRSPLTAAEAIALATHTNVLLRHYVWAAGSCYFWAGGVPYVYLDHGVPVLLPSLYWSSFFYPNNYWGSASCLR